MTSQVKKLFDEKSISWDQKYALNGELKQRLLRFIEIIHKHIKPEKLLDAGCGSGIFIEYFNNLNVATVGVDISEGMIKYAKEKKYTNPELVKFYCSNIESLADEIGGFDTVISSSVIEYVENDVNYLSTLYSMMQPNGILFITVPNSENSIRKKEKLLTKLKFALWLFSFIPPIKNYLTYLKTSKNRYAPSNFISLANKVGFTCIEYDGFNYTNEKQKFSSSTLIIFVLKK